MSSITADTAAQAIIDGGVPASIVEERINQRATKHQSNMVKMNPGLRDQESYQSLLATVTQARQRCCRPQGRKTVRSISRRSQASRTGWLGSQGAGRMVTCFAETRRALRRWHELNGAERRRREKQRRGNRGERRRRRLYSTAKKHGEATQQPSHASVKPEVATGATESRWKLADGEVSPAGTVQGNYRIATRLISQITFKFVW